MPSTVCRDVLFMFSPALQSPPVQTSSGPLNPDSCPVFLWTDDGAMRGVATYSHHHWVPTVVRWKKHNVTILF